MNSHINSHDRAILRRATTDDFDALYTLWMQDHIIPFMTFERLPIR